LLRFLSIKNWVFLTNNFNSTSSTNHQGFALYIISIFLRMKRPRTLENINMALMKLHQDGRPHPTPPSAPAGGGGHIERFAQADSLVEQLALIADRLFRSGVPGFVR
jgi:hypothetical protein